VRIEAAHTVEGRRGSIYCARGGIAERRGWRRRRRRRKRIDILRKIRRRVEGLALWVVCDMAGTAPRIGRSGWIMVDRESPTRKCSRSHRHLGISIRGNRDHDELELCSLGGRRCGRRGQPGRAEGKTALGTRQERRDARGRLPRRERGWRTREERWGLSRIERMNPVYRPLLEAVEDDQL